MDALDNSDVISRVSTKRSRTGVEGKGQRIAFIDMGAKAGIIRDFKKRGCEIFVFPYNVGADAIEAVEPDMIFISNGPGDPRDVPGTVETVKKLVGKYKICGICMGHPDNRSRARLLDRKAQVRPPRRRTTRSRTSRPARSI